ENDEYSVNVPYIAAFGVMPAVRYVYSGVKAWFA
ncbi:unnamed protein product, partial [marine sediment metagenome]